MPAILLFCTSKVSVEASRSLYLSIHILMYIIKLIKELVVESQKPQGTSNLWTLVQDPSQTEFVEGITSLSSPITSGFLHSSIDNIAKFVQDLPEDNNYDKSTFVILDSRSVLDKTVSIHHLAQEMPEDVPEGEWIHERVVSLWKDWRVSFEAAAYIASYLEYNVWGYVHNWGFTGNKDGEVLDEEGVLRLPGLKMKEFDMLDEDGWPA